MSVRGLQCHGCLIGVNKNKKKNICLQDYTNPPREDEEEEEDDGSKRSSKNRKASSAKDTESLASNALSFMLILLSVI